MNFNKKSLVILLVSLFIVLGIAATKPPEEHKFKNLKVLPKDITPEQLDKVMDKFKEALGVHCTFCHAPSKDTTNHHPDFASDDKPEKNIARKMMKMSAKINKKFFQAKKDSLGMVLTAGINCNTCHNGTAHPEVKIPEEHKGPGGPPPGGPATPSSGK